MKKLSNNRYINAGAGMRFYRDLCRLKDTPADKQRKFFARLQILCKENNVATGCLTAKTRIDYSEAIDEMIQRLKASGIDIFQKQHRALGV